MQEESSRDMNQVLERLYKAQDEVYTLRKQLRAQSPQQASSGGKVKAETRPLTVIIPSEVTPIGE